MTTRGCRALARSTRGAESEFLANLSHALPTRLNAIIGYAEMLTDEATDSGASSLVPALEKARSAGRHLVGITSDVLDLSKIEAGKMAVLIEEFDTTAHVGDAHEVIEPLVPTKSDSSEVRRGPELSGMSSGVTKVRHVLFNLLSNACSSARYCWWLTMTSASTKCSTAS